MDFWFSFIIGIIVALCSWFLGYYTGKIDTTRKLSSTECGTVLIETSDPDGPYLFLDLSVPVDEIGKQDKVTFKVDTNGVVRE